MIFGVLLLLLLGLLFVGWWVAALAVGLVLVVAVVALVWAVSGLIVLFGVSAGLVLLGGLALAFASFGAAVTTPSRGLEPFGGDDLADLGWGESALGDDGWGVTEEVDDGDTFDDWFAGPDGDYLRSR